MRNSNNKNLSKAKNTKNDEFYTLYEDIEKEIKHYDKDNFKDKIIYCNCDDYRFSNFVKFFKDNFKELGLKGLISTNYNIGDGSFYYAYNGVKEVIKEIENGSFDSEFCLALLEKSDLIITNPPFSLSRKYIDLLVSKDKKFLVIGNQNVITYKNIFPLIKENRIFLGISNGSKKYRIPNHYSHIKNIKVINEEKHITLGNTCWFTNITHRKTAKKLYLHKTCKGISDIKKYRKYHNCDAIDVPKSSMIPYNYNGVMGVPITYLENFDYDTFEIVGLSKSGMFENTFKYKNPKQINDKGVTNGDTINTKITLLNKEKPIDKTYYIADNVEGYITVPYARLLIKRKEIP